MFMKKQAEAVPEELTAVWSCTNDSCNGWMRDHFSFRSDPVCPLCNSDMTAGERMLPILTGYAARNG